MDNNQPMRIDGTYDNNNKRITRRLRNYVLSKIEKGGGRYVELGGKWAGVTSLNAARLPGVQFDIVETDPKCITSLNEKPELKYENVNIPSKPIGLEEYLTKLDDKIHFIDADFRGYASPKTLTFMNLLKKECIPDEGVEVWINVSRLHGRLVDTGLGPSNIPKIQSLLEKGGNKDTLTRYATMVQVALTDVNADPGLKFKFDSNLHYQSSSTGEKETVSMFTLRCRMYDAERSPIKENEYNFKVHNVGNTKDPAEKELDLSEEAMLIRGDNMPVGYRNKEINGLVSVIERFKMSYTDLEKHLGVSKNRRPELKLDLEKKCPDANLTYLDIDRNGFSISEEDRITLHYLAFGKESLWQRFGNEVAGNIEEIATDKRIAELEERFEKRYLRPKAKSNSYYVPTGRPRGRPRKVVEVPLEF